MSLLCFACKDPAQVLLSWPGVVRCPYCEGCAQSVYEQVESEMGDVVTTEAAAS